MIGKLLKKEKKLPIEPKHYKVGVTSGIPSIDKATAPQQVQMVVTKGVKVIEIDLEFPTSVTPIDIEKLRSIGEAQKLEFTIHGATNVSLPTTSAEKLEYKRVDDDMKEYIKVAKKIGAKAINIHSSYLPSPFFYRETRKWSYLLVDENGNPIEDKLLRSEKALNWFALEEMKRHTSKASESLLLQYLTKKYKDMKKAEEEFEKLFGEEKEKMILEAWKDYIREVVKKKVESVLSMAEYHAYIIVAWDMYENKDPLWKNICGKKDPIELIESGEEGKLVDAVAAKYLEGHINKLLKDLEKNKITLLIEVPDCRSASYRGHFRLVRPKDICHLMKKIDNPYVRCTIDFEHVATHGLDVMKEIKALGPRDGEYVKMLHVGSNPSPAHLHIPVERGDIYLYKLMWELRLRGFMDGYILYEWGGGRREEVRWLESVQNLKRMAIYLEADIPPDKLPKEFFGLTEGEIERERRIIERNMFNPLQGTLEAPELSHTWFGGEILKKKKPKEVWEREEFR
ncbi:MAG: sugar phosphate isomerase/epimerase [Candidatus Aenigmarchaeota archaeon]|nr:sugar phosphate isomerase/epimerase [Candidatus Aenigmarchaeota archaeon]